MLGVAFHFFHLLEKKENLPVNRRAQAGWEARPLRGRPPEEFSLTHQPQGCPRGPLRALAEVLGDDCPQAVGIRPETALICPSACQPPPSAL